MTFILLCRDIAYQHRCRHNTCLVCVCVCVCVRVSELSIMLREGMTSVHVRYLLALEGSNTLAID